MTIATAAAAAAERVAGPRAAAETGGAWLVIACDADGLPVFFCPVLLLCSSGVCDACPSPADMCPERSLGRYRGIETGTMAEEEEMMTGEACLWKIGVKK